MQDIWNPIHRQSCSNSEWFYVFWSQKQQELTLAQSFLNDLNILAWRNLTWFYVLTGKTRHVLTSKLKMRVLKVIEKVLEVFEVLKILKNLKLKKNLNVLKVLQVLQVLKVLKVLKVFKNLKLKKNLKVLKVLNSWKSWKSWKCCYQKNHICTKCKQCFFCNLLEAVKYFSLLLILYLVVAESEINF